MRPRTQRRRRGYNAHGYDPGNTIMRVNGEPRSPCRSTDPKTAATPLQSRRHSPQYVHARALRREPENQTLAERCLTSFGYSAGPVMLPLLYNNNYEIVQSKDTVAIVVEMVHDVRIIHIGGKHRTDGSGPGWAIPSAGTRARPWLSRPPISRKTPALRGAWKELKVTERLTRVGAHRILYQFTASDPTVWDRPWSGEYEFSPSKGRIFEYACHEGNYALEGILSGARADEAAAAEKAKAAAANKTAAAPAAPSGKKKQ